jgi:hypothetical protein
MLLRRLTPALHFHVPPTPPSSASRNGSTSPVAAAGFVRYRPSDEERAHIDRFVAAFVLKKNGPPAGHWKVPGVGYCVFLRSRVEHLEQ